MKKYNLLITGANGFIGKAACKYFINKGYSVWGLIRKPLLEKEKIKNVKYVIGDVRRAEDMLRVTENIETIVHFAARKSDEKDSYDVNIGGAKNIVFSAQKNGVKSIIAISTLSVRIKNKGTYAKTKAEAERVFMRSKIPTIILRPSIIYGDKINGIFGTLVKSTNLPIVPVIGDGKTIFYPLYVDDFLQIIHKIIASNIKRNEIFDVCGKEPISFNDLLLRIAASNNRHVLVLHIPEKIGIFAAFLLRLLPHPPITVSNILGSTQDTNPQIQKIYSRYTIKSRSLKEGLYEIFGKRST